MTTRGFFDPGDALIRTYVLTKDGGKTEVRATYNGINVACIVPTGTPVGLRVRENPNETDVRLVHTGNGHILASHQRRRP